MWQLSMNLVKSTDGGANVSPVVQRSFNGFFPLASRSQPLVCSGWTNGGHTTASHFSWASSHGCVLQSPFLHLQTSVFLVKRHRPNASNFGSPCLNCPADTDSQVSMDHDTLSEGEQKRAWETELVSTHMA